MQSPLELWGGVECTLNRVHDVFFDQLSRSGHRDRALSDLQLFADLGIRALRVALHWEHFERTQSWAHWDALLAEMQRLGIRPIVGLVHHGSGPPDTHLLDPDFPHKLAAFALKVAQRYPHVLDYTPVNEPQTTGRFAALYGWWFPHERSFDGYVRTMHHQIKGVVLAMQAVRSVQPAARLIHTEDGGETFATPPLEHYRVAREQRRWLGLDLLCGRIDDSHPLYSFLHSHGLNAADIAWFTANPCPPSVIGLNYYVTSDRFLDHRRELYGGSGGGDTGTEPLVDIEAVRVRAAGIRGVGGVIRQVWQRYGLPIAVTEAHLGCDPLEQTRWLYEVWQAAQAARTEGIDVRAVTAWALLGSYDWCHLCTNANGTYEPGVFDLRSGSPQPTALAELLCQLNAGLTPPATVREPGWWHQPSRLTVPPWPPQAEPAVVADDLLQPERISAAHPNLAVAIAPF